MKFIRAGLSLAFIEVDPIAVMETIDNSLEKYTSLPKMLFNRKTAFFGQHCDVKNVERQTSNYNKIGTGFNPSPKTSLAFYY
jgi:hypothetical protein